MFQRSSLTIVFLMLLHVTVSFSQEAIKHRLPEEPVVLRDLAYVAHGDERQSLDLYIPTKVENPPLVVCVHGGGWKQGNKNSPRGLKELLEAGIAVASINYRYSQQAVFPAQIEDCKSAVRWLRANSSKYGFDPERIGAWGGSAGGHLVALLGTTGETREYDVGEHLDVSSRVQAVCDWYGPTDFSQMDAQLPVGLKGMKHDPVTSPESRLIGGPIQDNLDRVRRANPIHYITEKAPPFLIFHGQMDTSVPVDQSRILADALKNAGSQVTFETIADDGHGLKQNGPKLVSKSIEFFVRTLSPSVEYVCEDCAQARTIILNGSNTKIENVEDRVHVRGGRTAFRHLVSASDSEQANYRAEFGMNFTEIGKTYWQGWSIYLPADFDYTASWLIISQWHYHPPHPCRIRPLPGGGAGHHMGIEDNRIRFTLQHADPLDPCGTIVEPNGILVEDVRAAGGKWIDFVMHSKWTGDQDGFCKIWVQIDNKGYEQKFDYVGRTWWNNEDKGPYSTMGIYRQRKKTDLPTIELFTDEFRLHDAASSFQRVRPDQFLKADSDSP